MKKRICALLLTAALALSLAPAAFAASQVSTEEAAQVLAAMDIMVGDERGNLNLTNDVTRAEFTKMAVAASPFAEGVGDTAMVSPYPDVTYRHWAASYVQAAVEHGLVNGYTDGTFRPGNRITLAEGATMALRLLGYTADDFTGAYPTGQMNLYRSLKLDQGVSSSTPSAVMSRQDALFLFYNLLTARTKTGQVYLTTLGYTLTASGEIDRVALINRAMDGPAVASGDWQSKIDFDLSTAKVYRNGAVSGVSAIRSGDVLYWSSSMRTLWVYSDQVTGTYQSASPSPSNPSAVTVAGSTYTIETASAAFALSDLGGHPVGSTVTLLLGRSGGVAAVLEPETAASAGTVYGVVTELGTASYTDASGNRYSAETVTLMGTDGRAHSYQWPTSSFHVGDVVQASATGATVTLSRASSGALSGVVNGTGTAIGSRPLAGDAAILETYGESGVRKVYPSRLIGVSLSGSAVRFYATNSSGEITDLILRDVTGDGHSYGVATSVRETGYGMILMGVYEYDLNGQKGIYQSSDKLFSVKEGPCGMVRTAAGMERLYNLTAVRLQSADGSTCMGADGVSYRKGDNVVVYERRNGAWYATTLSRVAGKSLTGYYDKAERDGGRIRVIVAQ